MSKILNSLINKKCKLIVEDAFSEIAYKKCVILDVDEQWVKVEFASNKLAVKTKVIRIDKIIEIEELQEVDKIKLN